MSSISLFRGPNTPRWPRQLPLGSRYTSTQGRITLFLGPNIMPRPPRVGPWPGQPSWPRPTFPEEWGGAVSILGYVFDYFFLNIWRTGKIQDIPHDPEGIASIVLAKDLPVITKWLLFPSLCLKWKFRCFFGMLSQSQTGIYHSNPSQLQFICYRFFSQVIKREFFERQKKGSGGRAPLLLTNFGGPNSGPQKILCRFAPTKEKGT